MVALKERKNEKRKETGSQSENVSHNPFMDATGLDNPDHKVASVTLGGFLKGIAKSAHGSVVDPDRYIDATADSYC